MAQALLIQAENPVPASRLMQDGTEIQHVVAERHGRQRQQLGWEEEALRREYAILGEVLEEAIRATGAEGAAVAAATELVGALLAYAERTSTWSFRAVIRP